MAVVRDFFKKRYGPKQSDDRAVDDDPLDLNAAISREHAASRNLKFPRRVFQVHCTSLPCKRCASSQSPDNDLTPCWFETTEVTAHLLARVALLTKMDEKMNVFGRNCMTLWNCRRIMTGKWLKIGEDEYDAPYPRVFSAVKEILEDRQGAFTIFSKNVLRALPVLPHLLMLASWKLDRKAVDDFTEDFYKRLNRYDSFDRMRGEDMTGLLSLPPLAEHREQLSHLRIGLERLAAYLAVLLIGTAHSEQDEDVRWDFNLSPEKAVHVFLAEYGTPSAHIFSVGSGKYVHVERFFVNLMRYHVTALRGGPPFAPVMASELVRQHQLLENRRSKRATKCHVCKSRIPPDTTIFPGEYAYSKNVHCYPRVIRNPARNREREGPRVACKPECVLHFLREYYADIGKILDDPACNIPKDFFRLRSVAEEGSHDVKKVRDHRSLFALGNFSSNEAMKFVGYVFRWDYNQDIVSKSNENFRLQDADVTDHRFPSVKRYANSMDSFVMGWQTANPRCLARIFHLPEERAFYEAVSAEPLRPDLPLSRYRARVASLAKTARGLGGPPAAKATFVLFWREEWGVFSDSCIGRHHIVDFDYYQDMWAVQPHADQAGPRINLKELDRNAGPENIFLALHVKRELFGLRDYIDGVKMVVSGDYRQGAKDDLDAVFERRGDCILFTQRTDLRRRTCVGGTIQGGFMFMEDGEIVAVLIPDMFNFLTSHFALSSLMDLFEAFTGPAGLTSHQALPHTTDQFVQLRDPSFCYKRAILMLSTMVAIRLNHEDHIRSDAIEPLSLTEEKITVPDVVDTWDEGQTTRIVALVEYEKGLEENEDQLLLSWNAREHHMQKKCVFGKCPVLQAEANESGYESVGEDRGRLRPTLAMSAPPVLFVCHGHNNFCRLVLYVWTSKFKATLCHAVLRDSIIVAHLSEKYPRLADVKAFYFNTRGVGAFFDANLEREDKIDRVSCLYLSDVYGAIPHFMELFLTDGSLGPECFGNLLSQLQPIDMW